MIRHLLYQQLSRSQKINQKLFGLDFHSTPLKKHRELIPGAQYLQYQLKLADQCVCVFFNL